MDKSTIAAKRQELETELAKGERLLRQQQASAAQTERTLLRIQGALSLLKELESCQCSEQQPDD